MKIGILTLPLNTNYGGILQAYALQTVLERMGHSVKMIDVPSFRSCRLPTWKRPLVYAKRVVFRYVLRLQSAPIFYERYLQDNQRLTRKFISKYLHSLPITRYSELHPENFESIVVGSDQVWRRLCFPHRNGISIEDAYLAFAEGWNIRRIAYAASFGTDDWEYTAKETERCGRLIRKFDAVSLRERSAVKIVKERFGVDAIHVLDPTMLLSEADYSHLIDAAEQDGTLHKSDAAGYILNYVLDDKNSITGMINSIAKSQGLSVVRSKGKPMTPKTFCKTDVAEYVHPPVESWLRNFRDCRYVITDSFHACVFSILFRKPFIVIGNKKRGFARFESLLSMFGLQDRLVIESSDYQTVLLRPIDYNKVYEKLEEYREKSREFIKSSLYE